MNKVYILITILLSAFLLRCGGNPEAEGDQSFANGKYAQAISYYLEVKKNKADNPQLDEKIALSYMNKGFDLYQKRHNIQAFAGNFEKGQDFIPEETSETFNKQYSVLLHKLAHAYYTTKPTNEIQKEQYFARTLELLDDALTFDETNAAAEKELSQIKSSNFKQTFKRGEHFYQQAQKEKNPDLYLTAEHYLERAVDFAPDNKDARKILQKVRKKTIAILNMDSDFPIAVPDKKYQKGFWMIAFTAMNNGSETIVFDPQKVTILDANEQVFQPDPEFTAKLDDGLVKAVSLKPRKQLDGSLAFKTQKAVKIKSIQYDLGNDKIVKKNFY